MKYTAIIVDDEIDAREGLTLLLQQDDDVKLLASCDHGLNAIAAIDEYLPDIVFLDVQMPQVNGFEVLRSLQVVPKAVVFVTAYDEFALKAFEVRAIDYLLKPFSDSRFFKALNHAKSVVSSNRSENKNIVESLPGGDSETRLLEKQLDDRLIVKENGKIHLLEFKDIVWLEAYDYYVKIHLANRFFLIRESLKRLEEKLAPQGFARIHKSTVVNLQYATTVQQLTAKEYMLILKNGLELKVSRANKKALFKALNLD